MAVATERAAWHVLVSIGALQAPDTVSAHAYHVVPMAYRVAGGLDPGNPCIPGPVSLVLLPAEQVGDCAPGHLHDGW